jgi:hypothetical protein
MAYDAVFESVRTASKKPSRDLLERTHNYLQRFADHVRLSNYRYEVTFGLYMLTYNEKIIVNSVSALCVIIFFGVLFSGIRTLLSSLYRSIAQIFFWLLSSDSVQQMLTFC